MSFEASIRQLRGNAGLSQQAVADAVGIARATYIKLENGGREPKLGELTKISQYYEVGVQELISGIAMTDTVAQQAQHSPWRVADDAALYVGDTPAEYRHDDAQGAQPAAAQSRDAIPRLHTTKLRQVLLYTLGKLVRGPMWARRCCIGCCTLLILIITSAQARALLAWRICTRPMGPRRLQICKLWSMRCGPAMSWMSLRRSTLATSSASSFRSRMPS